MAMRLQNKVLLGIADVPWYVQNSDLHRDFNAQVIDIVKKMAHPNTEAIKLLNFRKTT